MEDVSDKDIVDSYGRVMNLYDGLTSDEGIDILISYYNTAFNVISDTAIERVRCTINNSINSDPIADFERAMKIIT